MEKIKTPLTVLIEKEENILRRYEALKFDDATIQMQKGFIGRLQEKLPTEREVIEKAYDAGTNQEVRCVANGKDKKCYCTNRIYCEHKYLVTEQYYFTQTFESYE